MTSRIETKLAELGLALPSAPQPLDAYQLDAYQHVVIVGQLAFVAGQPPLIGSERSFTGRLEEGAGSIEKGQAAAKLAVLNVLA